MSDQFTPEPDKRDAPDERLQSNRAHSARVWGYLLGGRENYPADRAVGDMILAMFPDFAVLARLQRRFLSRAVRFLAAEAGVRQFLDIGAGLPTDDNTHEVAQRAAPDSRTVYVDNDPLVLVHARALMTSTPEGACGYIDADVRDPELILEQAAGTLDLSRPVALTLMSIMGQLPDSDDPWGLVRRLLDPLPPGSYLALTDGTNTNPVLNHTVETYNARSVSPYHLRSPEDIARFFNGLELVEPGVVATCDWRAEKSEMGQLPKQVDALCGIARKPN